MEVPYLILLLPQRSSSPFLEDPVHAIKWNVEGEGERVN